MYKVIIVLIVIIFMGCDVKIKDSTDVNNYPYKISHADIRFCLDFCSDHQGVKAIYEWNNNAYCKCKDNSFIQDFRMTDNDIENSNFSNLTTSTNIKDSKIVLEDESKEVTSLDNIKKEKLEAFKEINAYYAKAISEYKGDWVPKVNMASGGKLASGVNGAMDLINMLTVKTANDLALDMNVKNKK